MQLDLFGGVQRGNVRLDELFAAYLECRRNKRRTTNALAFEVDFEQKLIELWKDVNDGTYMPGRSIAFIVTEPVQREVFAADFRDRIIHHLIIGKLNHLFEASIRNRAGGRFYPRMFAQLHQRLLYSEDGYSVFFHEH